MTLDQLFAVGFTVTAGQIDRANVNYGFLSKDGPVLTPAGEVLAAELVQPKPRRRFAKAGAAGEDDAQS